jgi:hypothetical protein
VAKVLKEEVANINSFGLNSSSPAGIGIVIEALALRVPTSNIGEIPLSLQLVRTKEKWKRTGDEKVSKTPISV